MCRADSFACCSRNVRRFAPSTPCVASVPMWATITASQAGYAMCVASVPVWAVPQISQAQRHARGFRVVHRFAPGFLRVYSQGEETQVHCAARSPNARKKRWRARRGCGGERGRATCGPLGTAGLHHRREKEAHVIRTLLSSPPSRIQARDSQMRLAGCCCAKCVSWPNNDFLRGRVLPSSGTS